ncbi:MAG TPA: hypothetical protein VLY04_09300 [Bryobacteraceae bacterium]|nr:hypothetical protein [Bryobacteraceae bacterium]
MKLLSISVLLAAAAATLGALAQVTATIDIDTTHTTPLNSNFSGFNDEVVFPAEYYDYRLNNLAAQLSPGWVRYPSGLFSDAFNWQTGLMVASWTTPFQGTSIGTLLAEGVAWTNGKGGGSFVDAATRAEFWGAKLIIDVNAFTDTPQSIGQMAAFAKANHIPVAVWELANEPYFFKNFFVSGADYVAKVKPFYDAIKAADPNAVVAIFFTDAGNTGAKPWDQSLASYPDKYWDAVTYHHYPAQSTGDFNEWMADENAVLASQTSAYVTGYLAPLNPAGMKFLISEFLPSSDGLGTGTSVTDGTLYGAVYAAEYVMRMSAVPSMLYVGMHALTGSRGVYAVRSHYTDVQNAYNQGTAIDTLPLDFGFYTVAQPMGLGVLNGVLRNATQVDATTVTGGATVAATGLGQMPALYAQAYTSTTGQESVVITNKSGTAHVVTLRVNGIPVSGALQTQFIAGSDPTVQNTASNQNAVAVQSTTSSNPVTVPAYSVVRVDLITPPVVSIANSASYAPGVIAPQEIVTLFGNSISSQTASVKTPTPTLGGISVQITDSAGHTQVAPLFSVSPTQAEILIPAGLAAGTAQVAVLDGSTSVLTGSATVVPSTPGLYSMNMDGAGVAAANAFRVAASFDHVYEPVFTCNPPAVRSCVPTPLSQGAATDTLYVELYGTGIRGAASVQVFVAGQKVPVLYSGPAPGYPGEDQVDISVPKSFAGAGRVRVYLVADGVASNVVTLSLQ